LQRDSAMSESGRSAWLALDVGGANLKACHGGGSSRTLAFEVWRKPEELGRAIGELAEGLPPFGRIALTMTAELCDCYTTKAQGVNAVLDAVAQAFPGFPVAVWGIDGAFHDVAEVRRRPRLAAAANWLALATAAARLVGEHKGLLVDIGSTTTDLIPLDQGKVAAIGRTDTERLRTGELVYAGVRRTPVCALATELPFRGQSTGLAAELFATTLDVFLMLGEINPDPADTNTADGRPATIECARNRLARMVGADRDGFSEDDAMELARSAAERLIGRLEACASRVCGNTIGGPKVVVVSGAGEFLGCRLAGSLLGGGRVSTEKLPSELAAPEHSHPPAPHPSGVGPPFARGGQVGEASPILSLAESWGAPASTAACACALLLLASESSFDHVPNQD
jgi:probable H4MPT-linked C1 transfer pathway protein